MKRTKKFIICFIILFTCGISYLHLQYDYRKTRSERESNQRKTFSELDSIPMRFIPSPKPVIVVTYMRSGSSLMGDILQSNPDVFYLFEPVRVIQNAIRNNISIDYLNKPSRNDGNFTEIAFESMAAFTECLFHSVPLNIWTSDGFLSYSRKAKEYLTCISEKEVQKPYPISSIIECINRTKYLCKQSLYIVIKTIRMSISALEPLLQQMPDLKIIHLIRDPRATARSQSRFGEIKVERDVTLFCERVYKDVLKAVELKSVYPGRIKTVFYEELAGNPIALSREIYKFLGFEFSNTAEERIKQMTSPGIDKECGVLRTCKANSSAQLSAWRKDIKMEYVNVVDQRCQPLYSKLGMKTIENEEQLRNLGYDLKEKSAVGDY